MANIEYPAIAKRLLANNAKKIAELNKAIEAENAKIKKVADRQPLRHTMQEVIEAKLEREEPTYKPVRATLQKNVRALSTEYFDGAYVSAQNIHHLTWAIINAVQATEDSGLDEMPM